MPGHKEKDDAADDTAEGLPLLLTIGVVGSVAGWGAYSAFTATTTNAGNTITAGTVAISQHAGAATLYSGSDRSPGSSIRCVRVTYTGSLASSVRLYVSSGITNGTAFNLQVERGSGLSSPDASMNCTGFSASSTAYNGNLGGFATDYTERRCRQGRRHGVEPERQRRLPLHDQRERRPDAERTHLGRLVRRPYVHLGGPQQLARSA